MTPCTVVLGESGACSRTDMHQHCALCGLSFQGELCNHHVYGAETWAAENRAACDFVHRGIVAPRPPEAEREIVHEWDVA